MKRIGQACIAMAFLFLGAMVGAHAQSASKPKTEPLSQSDLISAEPAVISYGRLLDPNVPMEERLAVFSLVEARARDGDSTALYVAGSMYRVGNALPSSPVEKDLAKARLYLSNAAAHGYVLAMAKMAELEVASKNQMDAMTWAQIYGHYAQLQPEDRRPSEGYLAELVERASRGIHKSQLQDVVDNLNDFVAAHDASVRAGIGEANAVTPDLTPVFIPNRSFNRRAAESVPFAGFADYLVGMGPDGVPKDIFLMDAIPDIRLGLTLRSYLQGYRVGPAPSADQTSLRYVFIPAVMDDRRFKLSKKSP